VGVVSHYYCGHIRQTLGADALLILPVRCSRPSCSKGSDDGEACGDLLVSLVGFLIERNRIVVDRKELRVLGFVHSSGEARSGLGFEVEHTTTTN